MKKSKLKVYIGSGEASLIERKVLIYSIIKNSNINNIDIYVFNGTHDSLEIVESGKVIKIGMPLNIKYSNVTEFSNYRFMIPQLSNFEGRSLWLDSDMLCLNDISILNEIEMNDCQFLCKKNAYTTSSSSDERWGLSAMLIDNSKTKFLINEIFEHIDQNKFSYTDLHQMSSNFLKYHDYKIGQLENKFNEFDFLNNNTYIIHYTNLLSQPWKFHSHKYGNIWFSYFFSAIKDGYLTFDDIEKSKMRSYVRQDIMTGNNRSLYNIARSTIKEFKNIIVSKI